MPRDSSRLCVLILGGLIAIPMGIAMHATDPRLPFGGYTTILGAAMLMAGIGGFIARFFRRLPADLAIRLQALEQDVDKYEEMARSEGPRFVRGYVEQLERADSLSTQWAPKLRQFAAERRAAMPCPRVESLSARDRAKIEIYETKIDAAERLAWRRKNGVIIRCLPTMAIPIAQRLWPGADERSVFLAPEELAEWNAVYTHPDDCLWWFMHYWWNVEDSPDPNRVSREDINLDVPDGSDPWLVTSGVQWGDLAGGEDVELWSWNGNDAKSLGIIGRCNF